MSEKQRRWFDRQVHGGSIALWAGTLTFCAGAYATLGTMILAKKSGVSWHPLTWFALPVFLAGAVLMCWSLRRTVRNRQGQNRQLPYKPGATQS